MQIIEIVWTMSRLVKALELHKAQRQFFFERFTVLSRLRKRQGFQVDELSPLQLFYREMFAHHFSEEIKAQERVKEFTVIADSALYYDDCACEGEQGNLDEVPGNGL